MFTGGEERRVKLQAAAVSKTTRENLDQRLICLDTDKCRCPTKCESDIKRGHSFKR